MKQFFEKVSKFASTAAIAAGFLVAIAKALETFNNEMSGHTKKLNETADS